MKRYRKRPVVIEAVQFDGTNFDEIYDWANPTGNPADANVTLEGCGDDPTRISINTREGVMSAGIGWWIIKGVKGEFYPCEDEIFRMTYEPEPSV